MMFLCFLVMLVVMSQFWFHAQAAHNEGRRTKMLIMLIGVVASFIVGVWIFALLGTKIAADLSFGESIALGALVEVIVTLLYAATLTWLVPWLLRRFPKLKAETVGQLAILPLALLLIIILR